MEKHQPISHQKPQPLVLRRAPFQPRKPRLLCNKNTCNTRKKPSASDIIINTDEKRVEVIANPGSGKTHTIKMRIKRLVANGVPATKILVLSFANETVKEFRRRMNAFDTDLSSVTVSTAHAFALKQIRKTGKREVLTDKMVNELLIKAMQMVRLDCRKLLLWPSVSSTTKQRRIEQLETLSEPSNIKLLLSFLAYARTSKMKVREAISTDKFLHLKSYGAVLRAIRSRFAAIKREKYIVDFGDMLSQATAVIKDGAVLPYSHVLIDEYQDCSPAQTHLLKQLATDDRSIMVFGDPHQSIYGFTGATYTPLSEVLTDVKILGLPMSWRLTAEIAALASAIAGHRPEQAIQTNKSGEPPILVKNNSLRSQTRQIVRHIQHLIEDGTPPQEIVVLARTNALLHPVEQLLLEKNILTARKGSKRNRLHMLRTLRLVRLVEQCAERQKKILPEALQTALPALTDVDDSIWQREAKALNKVLQVRSVDGRYRLCAAIYLRLMGGVRKDAELRADVNRWEPFCRGHDNAGAVRAAVKAMDEMVTTGTIHSVKGGEWDHVLVVGVTDGYLPHFKARDEQALREERNLLYVAVTRARKAVRLYHAPAVHARSRKSFDDVSRFLDSPAVQDTLRSEGRR